MARLRGSETQAFCTRPDPACLGTLLYGEDPGQVLDARKTLVRAVLGGDDDAMRIDQLEQATVQKDPAALDDALRARGFFPGRRVVLIQGAGDRIADAVKTVLPGLTGDDGFLVLTAGILPARSKLRKLFEATAGLVAAPLFPAPMSPRDIEDRLTGGGATCGLTRAAADRLAGLAGDMDHGAFVQLLDIVSLYALDRTEPLGPEDIDALAPVGIESAVDELVAAMADGQPSRIGPLLRRLSGSGANAVGLTIAAERHFRQMLTLAVAPEGAAQAVSRMRPPVFGPRRDAILRQVRAWGVPRLETANRLLFETDRRLRSPGPRPDLALAERCFLRLAMMGARR